MQPSPLFHLFLASCCGLSSAKRMICVPLKAISAETGGEWNGCFRRVCAGQSLGQRAIDYTVCGATPPMLDFGLVPLITNAYVCPRQYKVLAELSWRSSVVEHLICNQTVGGSSPFASSKLCRAVQGL